MTQQTTGGDVGMKSKAWVLMPHAIRKGNNGIEVENEILPLVMCCDCIHYNREKKWCQHMEVANGDKWFCADGERRLDDD